ncbi:MAG: alpha/beta hydrolase [Rhodobacter sp.]|nr:alpha/beta hydrolase [Rhodobacter sp.]
MMIHSFANCELDPRSHSLRRAGVPVHVEPQVFDLLHLMVRSGNDMVSYDRVIQEVWAGRIVSDATLSSRISAARKAVGDTGSAQSIIRTIARRGLQLVVPVTMRRDVEAAAPEQATQPGPPEVAARQQIIRYVTSGDGVSIAYAISGRGPPLVRVGHWLTHLDLDWESPVWRPLIDRLGQTHTVFRYDQRGTGLSAREFPGRGIDEFVDDLRAVVDATGADRVPIFTASQGVPTALKFAVENPDRVSRLVLVGGYFQGRYFRGSEEARQVARTQLELVRAGWGKAGSPYLKLFSQIFMPGGTDAQLESFVAMMLASASPQNAARLRDVIDNFDISDIVSKVRARVLLIHARGDNVHPVEQSQTMARKIPGAELIVLDSPNHVPLPTDPAWQIIMDETERFLAAD